MLSFKKDSEGEFVLKNITYFFYLNNCANLCGENYFDLIIMIVLTCY